jgi:hypothetical protein
MTVAVAPAEDRAKRYTARLDLWLAGLPSDKARYDFLGREQVLWLARYERFVRAVDAGADPDGVHVDDYLATIAAIDTRRARYAP